MIAITGETTRRYGLGGHRNHASELLRIHTVRTLTSPFEVSYLAYSAILLRRGVPVGVVYAGIT